MKKYPAIVSASVAALLLISILSYQLLHRTDPRTRAYQYVLDAKRLALGGDLEQAIEKRKNADDYYIANKDYDHEIYQKYVTNRIRMAGYYYKIGDSRTAVSVLPKISEGDVETYYFVLGVNTILCSRFNGKEFHKTKIQEIIELSKAGQIQKLSSVTDFSLYLLSVAYACDYAPNADARDVAFEYYKSVYGPEALSETFAQLGKTIIGSEDNFIMVDLREWLKPYVPLK